MWMPAPCLGRSFGEGAYDPEARDRGVGRWHRLEATYRLDQHLQLAVVGLEHVVQIFHLPVLGFRRQFAFAFQLSDCCAVAGCLVGIEFRSEEHTSELQSLMRISYAVFCLKKKKTTNSTSKHTIILHKINT